MGLTSDALVTHGDILPTLVRAAGGEVPTWSDGQNLLPVVRGEQAAVRTHLDGYWLENAYWIKGYDQPDYLSITDGQWKYIWYPEGGREQLFDLVNDPEERWNLACKAGEPVDDSGDDSGPRGEDNRQPFSSPISSTDLDGTLNGGEASVIRPETCQVAERESRDKLRELRTELIARQAARGLPSVKNGQLVAIPEIPLDLRLIRARCHYGLHGELFSGRGQPNGDILH